MECLDDNNSAKLINNSLVPCWERNHHDHEPLVHGYAPSGVHVLGYMGMSLGCLAILLNLLFLCCVCCLKDRSSAYNRFIQNLSVCDILGSITFIITQNWPQGPFAYIIENQELSHVWRQVQIVLLASKYLINILIQYTR